MGKGVRRVFDKLNKTGHDVKLTLYPRIRHALITEMNSAQVYEPVCFLLVAPAEGGRAGLRKRDGSRA